MMTLKLDTEFAEAHGIEAEVEVPGRLVAIRSEGGYLEIGTTERTHRVALSVFEALVVRP